VDTEPHNTQATAAHLSEVGQPTHGPLPWRNLFWWGGVAGLVFAVGNLVAFAFSLAMVPSFTQPTIDILNTLWLARAPITAIAGVRMALYTVLLLFAGAAYRAVPQRARRLMAVAVGALALNILLELIVNAISLTVVSPLPAGIAHNANASAAWVELAFMLALFSANLGIGIGLLQVLALGSAAFSLRGVDGLPRSITHATLTLAALRLISVGAGSSGPAHAFSFVCYLLMACWVAALSFWLLALSDPWAQPIRATGEHPAVTRSGVP